MRWLLALLVLALSACSAAVAPPLQPVERTAIGGTLIGETVLDGTYLLTTDLLIPKGSRLVIMPGTSILVRRAEFTKIDPEFLSSLTEILVRGTLVIKGTASQPVIIAAEKPAAPDDPGWAGILADNVRASKISHALISGADTALLLVSADLELNDSRLEQNRYGLIIQGGKPSIVRNLVTGGEGGLFLWNEATPVLNANVISYNEEEGVYIDRSSHPESSGNRSEQNAIGLISFSQPDQSAFRLINNETSWRQLLPRQVTQ